MARATASAFPAASSAALTRSVSSRRAYLAHEIFPRDADNDDLYTFARFDFAVLALHWRF